MNTSPLSHMLSSIQQSQCQFDNYVVVENEGAVEVCVVLTVPLITATEVFIVPRTTGSATGGARITFVYQNFTCNLNFAICL